MRVTGVVLLGVAIIGLLVRLVPRVRFGRSGSDTIPLVRRSAPGNPGEATSETDGRTARATRADAPAPFAGVSGATTPYEEETEVAIKEPSITASPNRALALTAGSLLALWGFLGFFLAADGDPGFFSRQGGMLWNAFGVNPAMSLLWVLLAAVLLITGLGTTIGARNGNRLVGVVLVVMAVYGFALGGTSANVFALTFADNLFHAIVGVVLLLTAFGADRENVRAIRAAARA